MPIAGPVTICSRFAATEIPPASADLLSAMIFAVFGVFALFAVSAVFRLNSANGDGDGENDRKERFHWVLKYSLLPARVRLLDCRRDCAGNRRFQFRKRHQLFIRTDNETFSVPFGATRCEFRQACSQAWFVIVRRIALTQL